jgi:hypothetical protein
MGVALGMAMTALAVAAPAAAWEVRGDAPEADFASFHRRFSFVAYPFPRHGAKPLGLTGFDVWVDAAADPDLDDEPFAASVIDGDVPGGWVTVARVGARKGLPGGVDLGASYAKAVDGGLDLASVEVQWAWADGGAVSPALSLRFTGTRTLSGDPYSLEIYGAEALLSKGFTVLTPYVGAGGYWTEGTLERPGGGRVTADQTRGFLYAGATLNLLLPKITVELEQGETLQAALRVAFGF